jgi:hypothetical protein
MPATARSLAEDLRRRTDDEVAALLRLRPDLASPVPKSFADLAQRANSAPSTAAALADLTAAELDVLEAACALAGSGRFTRADLSDGLGRPVDDPAVAEPVAELFRRMLLWGSGDDIRVPSAAREMVGPHPCGLDPVPRGGSPALRRALADPQALLADLARQPADVAAAVEQIAWGPPTTRPTGNRGSATAVAWLADRDLLMSDESIPLHLPREAALLLRRGRLLQHPRLEPPREAPPGDSERIGRECGYRADHFLRELDRVMARVADQTPALAAGGRLRGRNWDAALAASGLEAGALAVIVAVAWSLVWLDTDDSGRLRPTTTYLDALTLPREQRWAAVVLVWLELDRIAAQDPLPGGSPPPGICDDRRLVLSALARNAPEAAAAWLRWARPRRDVSDSLLAATVAEAAELGLLSASGALPIVATLAVDPADGGPDAGAVAAAIAAWLPPLRPELILQADLTATALGALPADMERSLGQVADWESGGGASVFRFTPESVRRGLGRGMAAADLLEWLAQHSRTAVPQALTVLVTDAERARTRLSVIAAGSVLRCDEATAAALRGDPALAGIDLRPLGPGLFATPLPADELARRLQAAGHLVAGADTGGEVVPPTRSRHGAQEVTATPSRIVRSLRRVEERAAPAQQPPGPLAPAPVTQIADLLRSASRQHGRLWLRFSDGGGEPVTHVVEPLYVRDGTLCAFDATSNEIRVIPLSRVTAAAAAH